MKVSIIDAFSDAMDWAGKVCFRPFDISKWFALGFCAFLANLSDGSWGSNWNQFNQLEDLSGSVGSADRWIAENFSLFLFFVALAIVLLLGLTVLLAWLSSRGAFMFLHGVVTDTGTVAEPWKRYRELGNSLFGFRVAIGIFALFVFGALFLGALVTLWPALRDTGLGSEQFLFLGIMVGVTFLIGIGFALVNTVVKDFLVPVMYLRDERVGTAWAEVRPLLGRFLGPLIVYVLIKGLSMVAIAILAVVLVCVTCCLAAIPYIGTVIMLPIFVFLRAFPLYVLAQFGDEFKRFANLGVDFDETVAVFE